MNDHVVSGLIKKRAELVGKISYYKKEIKVVNEELKHLDSTIKLFNPDIKLNLLSEKVFRPNKSCFKQGEISRLIFDILKSKNEPMKVKDIAHEIMNIKDFGYDIKTIFNTIRRILYHYTKRGVLKTFDNDDLSKSWAIK